MRVNWLITLVMNINLPFCSMCQFFCFVKLLLSRGWFCGMCSSTSIFMTIYSLQSALIVLISCKTRRSLRSTLNYVTQSLPDYIASFLLVYMYLPIIVSYAIYWLCCYWWRYLCCFVVLYLSVFLYLSLCRKWERGRLQKNRWEIVH